MKLSAIQNGYSTDLYDSGNSNLVIGDYGSKARQLYDGAKISESHYQSLLLDMGMNTEEVEGLFSAVE